MKKQLLSIITLILVSTAAFAQSTEINPGLTNMGGSLRVGVFTQSSQSLGKNSISAGSNSFAYGDHSIAAGENTVTKARASAAFGINNHSWGTSDYPSYMDPVLMVGNGITGVGEGTSNAFVILRNGFTGIRLGQSTPEGVLHLNIDENLPALVINASSNGYRTVFNSRRLYGGSFINGLFKTSPVILAEDLEANVGLGMNPIDVAKLSVEGDGIFTGDVVASDYWIWDYSLAAGQKVQGMTKTSLSEKMYSFEKRISNAESFRLSAEKIPAVSMSTLQSLAPAAIVDGEKGKAVDMYQLNIQLLSAFQKQQEQIESQKKEIELLKVAIQELKSKQ